MFTPKKGEGKERESYDSVEKGIFVFNVLAIIVVVVLFNYLRSLFVSIRICGCRVLNVSQKWFVKK